MTIILRIEEEKDATNEIQQVAFITIRANDSDIVEDIHAVAGISEYPQLQLGINGLVKHVMKLRQEQVKEKNKGLFKKKLLAKKQK